MAISDLEAIAWLEVDQAYRNVIVQLDYFDGSVEGTKYISQRTFGSYEACLLPGFTYNESLSLTGSPSLSVGAIKIDNTNGVRDHWIDYIWANRRIRVLGGDVRWDVSDYRNILDGVINSITSDSENSLTFIIQDKLQRLNTPVTEYKLGGTTANKEAIIPFSIGECCNVTPLLVDPIGPTGTGLYRYHALSSEEVIEVRANEFPMSFTADYVNSTFYTTYMPSGTVTCSVKGHKVGGTTYINKIGDIIKEVVKIAGKPETRFTDADIDLAQVASFTAAYPQPVGYFGNSQDNILTLIQGLAASVGAQVICTKEGLLRIITLDKTTPVKVITSQDMKPKSLTFSSVGGTTGANGFDVKAGVVLGFCKNYTVQESQGDKIAIPQEHQDLFAKEYRTVTVKDTAVETAYKLHVTPTQEDTYLLTEADALTEANRRLNFWKVKRRIYSFDGLATCIHLTLGQTVTLKHNRFGLTNGVDGIIIGLSFDWLAMTVRVQVLV